MATVRLQSRRDTLANWTTHNPILGSGEHGFETDTGYERIGDGSTAFLSLGCRHGAYIHYDDYAAFAASTEGSRGVGAIWSFGPFSGEEVASGDISNSAGTPVQLDVLVGADGRRNVLAFGATGDGVTDDTVALQAALDAGPCVAQGGTYNHTGLVSTTSFDLLMHSDAKLFLINSSDTHSIQLTNVTSATIEGGEIDGNRANQAGTSHGIFGYGDNVRIEGIYVHDVLKTGIVCSGGTSWRILGNRVIDCVDTGIFTKPTDADAIDIEIMHNLVDQSVLGVVNTNGGIKSQTGASVGVPTNKVNRYKCCYNTCVLWENAAVAGNVIGFTTYGDAVGDFTNVEFIGNTIRGGSMAFTIKATLAAAVVGNTCVGQELAGIEVAEHAPLTAVSGNSVAVGATVIADQGIWVSGTGSEGTVISGNTVDGAKQAINVVNSDDVSVIGNSLKAGSTTTQLLDIKGRVGWSVVGNRFDGDGVANSAILLDESEEGVISGNHVSGCANFVRITSGTSFTADNIPMTGNRLNVSGAVLAEISGGLWGTNIRLIGNVGIADYADYTAAELLPKSDGTTGGTGSAGAGTQYVELDINGTVYKVLHDGTV